MTIPANTDCNKRIRNDPVQSCDRGHASGWLSQYLPRTYNVAAWDWDILNNVCRYSPEWSRMLADPEENWNGSTTWSWWSGRMHMDDMPRVKRHINDIMEGGDVRKETVFRFQRGDGRWIWILARGEVNAWTEDGKPCRMSGIALDISSLRENECFLREAPALTCGEMDGCQRISLSERRLNALNHLIQMDDASEAEVLHYVLISMRQLTDSGSSFMFIPEKDSGGKGRFLWSPHSSGTEMDGPNFPREFLEFVHTQAASSSSMMENGDGSTPVVTLYEGRVPVFRCIVAQSTENGRTACIAGVCNKAERYDVSDVRQIEMFIHGAWLILRRRLHMEALRQAKEAAETARGRHGRVPGQCES